MNRYITTYRLLLLFLFSSLVAQAQVACKLLQPGELESVLKEWALGGKATEFSGSTYNAGSTAFDLCTSEIVRPRKGNLQITVVIVNSLPMEGGEAIRTRNAELARQGQWKVKGAQFEQKTVGKAMCTLAGRLRGSASSVCAIPRGNGYVEVEVRAPTLEETPSMDAARGAVANGEWPLKPLSAKPPLNSQIDEKEEIHESSYDHIRIRAA